MKLSNTYQPFIPTIHLMYKIINHTIKTSFDFFSQSVVKIMPPFQPICSLARIFQPICRLADWTSQSVVWHRLADLFQPNYRSAKNHRLALTYIVYRFSKYIMLYLIKPRKIILFFFSQKLIRCIAEKFHKLTFIL